MPQRHATDLDDPPLSRSLLISRSSDRLFQQLRILPLLVDDRPLVAILEGLDRLRHCVEGHMRARVRALVRMSQQGQAPEALLDLCCCARGLDAQQVVGVRVLVASSQQPVQTATLFAGCMAVQIVCLGSSHSLLPGMTRLRQGVVLKVCTYNVIHWNADSACRHLAMPH